MWAAEIKNIAAKNPGLDYEGVYWAMYLDLVKKGAEAILPVYQKSGGQYGFLSGQVDPRFVRDGDKMLAQGLQIYAQAPNVDGQAARLEGRLRGARGADRARHQHQQHHQLHGAAVHALHGRGQRRALSRQGGGRRSSRSGAR